MIMFQRQKSGTRTRSPRENVGNESSAKDLQTRIAQLRGLPREKLADAVFMLSLEAKQQSSRTRQAVKERTQAEPDFELSPDADLATHLAADAVLSRRHDDAALPTLLDVLVQRSPEVRFTAQQEEAVLMLAAMFREQRLEGILEGLRLAGILNEPAKDRHAGGYS